MGLSPIKTTFVLLILCQLLFLLRQRGGQNFFRDAPPGNNSPAALLQDGNLTTSPSPSTVLHILSTRFMQHQAHLEQLGAARLELFETFCWPTILQQKSQDFVWMMRVDPDLPETLLQKLQGLFEPHPHYFLLKTNDNNVTAVLEEIRRNTSMVVTGDVSLIQRPPSHIIETLLDADDGLRSNYLQHVQQRALNNIRQLNATDVFYCVGKHYEWHFGSSESANQTQWLIPRTLEHCITAGLTKVWPYGIKPKKLPHHKLVRTFSNCQNPSESGDTTDEVCWMRLSSKILHKAAIRARTLTSAGMADVADDDEHYENRKTYKPKQSKFWKDVQRHFGISQSKAWATMQLLESQAAQIATENLQGQCTQGHSCKDTARTKLLETIGTLAGSESKQEMEKVVRTRTRKKKKKDGTPRRSNLEVNKKVRLAIDSP